MMKTILKASDHPKILGMKMYENISAFSFLRKLLDVLEILLE